MRSKDRKGQFEVIDSFAIRRRNEFYLIGQLLEGTVEENWFIHVPFNKTMVLTVRISAIEEVELSSERKKYVLLIVKGDNELMELLLGLHIGSEVLDIKIEGED